MRWIVARFRHIHEALAKADFYWQIGYYGLLFAGLTHVGFVFLFLWLDIPWMAFVNVGSVLMYGYAVVGVGLYTLRTKDDRLIGWLVYAELMGHNMLASYFLSKAAGFQYYIYALVILPFFITTYGRTVYIARVVTAIAVAMWIDISPLFEVPKVAIDVSRLTWLHHVNLLAFLAILGVLAYLYAFYETMHRSALFEKSTKDALTRLYNRRYVETYVENNDLSVYGIILIDIDWFKRINDTYGHVCGDKVITETANRIVHMLPEHAIASRWGGEEFLILLPETDMGTLETLARQMHEGLRQTTIEWQGETIVMTVTVGAVLRRTDESFEVTLMRADEALYAGKMSGRDRVQLLKE